MSAPPVSRQAASALKAAQVAPPAAKHRLLAEVGGTTCSKALIVGRGAVVKQPAMASQLGHLRA